MIVYECINVVVIDTFDCISAHCNLVFKLYFLLQQLLFVYFMRLFRDEQKIQNDSEVEGMTNNGMDSIPCEGGLVVKNTEVSVACISDPRVFFSVTWFALFVLRTPARLYFVTQRLKPKQNW